MPSCSAATAEPPADRRSYFSERRCRPGSSCRVGQQHHAVSESPGFAETELPAGVGGLEQRLSPADLHGVHVDPVLIDRLSASARHLRLRPLPVRCYPTQPGSMNLGVSWSSLALTPGLKHNSGDSKSAASLTFGGNACLRTCSLAPQRGIFTLPDRVHCTGNEFRWIRTSRVGIFSMGATDRALTARQQGCSAGAVRRS